MDYLNSREDKKSRVGAQNVSDAERQGREKMKWRYSTEGDSTKRAFKHSLFRLRMEW